MFFVQLYDYSINLLSLFFVDIAISLYIYVDEFYTNLSFFLYLLISGTWLRTIRTNIFFKIGNVLSSDFFLYRFIDISKFSSKYSILRYKLHTEELFYPRNNP